PRVAAAVRVSFSFFAIFDPSQEIVRTRDVSRQFAQMQRNNATIWSLFGLPQEPEAQRDAPQTTRKPIVWLALSGPDFSRAAELQESGLRENHPPPRTTRSVPSRGPDGSEDSPPYGAYQSQHHSL